MLRGRFAFVFGVVSLLAVACSSSTPKKALSDGCTLSSDCSGSLVCTFGRCHAACEATKDCPSGQSCIKASDGTKVCQLPVEQNCLTGGNCATPLTCGADGKCRGQCTSNSDCTTGQKCTSSGSCAEPTQVDSNNNLIVSNDAGAGGSSNAGGTSSRGGSSATGGSTNGGGNTAVGGITSAGGASAAGAVSTGGAATGGATSTGGAVNTGGTKATGGVTTGGAATGGTTPSTGGAATGGSPITGGASSTAPTCTIDSGSGSVSYPIGTANTANRCLVCNPTVSMTTWTPDAVACGCTGSFETLDSAGNCIGNFETLDSAGHRIGKMVTISAPSAIQNYSIDVTEVTKGQYDSWLATNPALPASTDANCAYVTSYAEQSTSGTYTGTDAGHHPVVFVDWCDAYAYCKGVGKRLCGAIGGGSVDYASGYADAAISQWYRACSSGGADTYPYAGTYQATYCNGGDYGASQTAAVGSLTNCVTSATGFAGVYDISGNVWEWEDSCDGTGQSATCHVRGGSFYNVGSSALTCDFGGYGGNARNFVGYGLGFRCCSP